MTKLVSEAFRCGDLRACDAAQRAIAEDRAETALIEEKSDEHRYQAQARIAHEPRALS
jgi:hypothetical protein